MKVFAFACIIFAVCISTSLQKTPFSRCYNGSKLLPQPMFVEVLGCYTKPCEFVEKDMMYAQWDFDAQTNVKSLKTEVHILDGTHRYPYPFGTDYDGCDSLLEGNCPLKRGEEATYFLEMYLLSITPQTRPFWFEFKTLDEKKKVQVCFRLHSKFMEDFPVSRPR